MFETLQKGQAENWYHFVQNVSAHWAIVPQVAREKKTEQDNFLFAMTAVNHKPRYYLDVWIYERGSLTKAHLFGAVYLSCCGPLNWMTPPCTHRVAGLNRVKMQMKYYQELVFEE